MRARLLAVSLAATLACATIETSSDVTIQPRAHAQPVIASEQLVARDYVAEYVQVGAGLSVEIRELRTCVVPHHRAVTRIEHVKRSSKGFVPWDFGLAVLAGAVSALAFARPEAFSPRLVDGQGREVRDYTGAWIVGGVFAGLSGLMLTVGTVDAVRSRDTSQYADAYTLDLGPEQPCITTPDLALRERAITLRLGQDQLVLEAVTDERGRARFELPPWPGELPASGQVPAVIEVSPIRGDALEPRVLVFPVWVPYGGMTDVQAGVADTRRPPEQQPLDLSVEPPAEGPVEGPAPPAEEPP
jgi:hypothetical protein